MFDFGASGFSSNPIILPEQSNSATPSLLRYSISSTFWTITLSSPFFS